MISAGRSRGDHVSAVNARTGTHIDHVVGSANSVFVVLDDDNGITDIAQALERLDQALVIALVKADRRLVQNVQNAHERAPICVARRIRWASPPESVAEARSERQIVESDIDQKTQAIQDFLDDAPADKLLTLGKLQALKKLERLAT